MTGDSLQHRLEQELTRAFEMQRLTAAATEQMGRQLQFYRRIYQHRLEYDMPPGAFPAAIRGTEGVAELHGALAVQGYRTLSAIASLLERGESPESPLANVPVGEERTEVISVVKGQLVEAAVCCVVENDAEARTLKDQAESHWEKYGDDAEEDPQYQRWRRIEAELLDIAARELRIPGGEESV